MALIWVVVVLFWGISLLLSLKLARIELTSLQRVIVIQVAAVALLVPVIGPYLAPVVAIYLIYRMADAELGIVIAAVLITRLIAALIAILVERALVQLGIL